MRCLDEGVCTAKQSSLLLTVVCDVKRLEVWHAQMGRRRRGSPARSGAGSRA